MKGKQVGRRPERGFGHSLPSKVVSCVASAALATMMLPAAAVSAFADENRAGTQQGSISSDFVKDLDGNGKIDVLLVGNSHAGDMTQYAATVASDAKTAGIGEGEVDVTVLAPMGGRRLYTDDNARGSHIAAATMDEAEYSSKHTQKDSKGNALAQNKSTYNAVLNKAGKTYDLVVLQDWHESTNDSDASKAATGVADAVKWIKSSNYSSIKDETKVAWAADWPDVANHESYQSNMAAAFNAVQELSEDKPDFIVPVGTAVENSRSSYFGSVNNAEDAFPVKSENTAGLAEAASKYNITARDANHLSYELGCYTASATLVGSVLKAEGVETSKITDALKTAPVTAESKTDGNAKDVAHEWKGEFTDSIWSVVKESVDNALDVPGSITQSQHVTDPADGFEDKILDSDFSQIKNAAAKAANEGELQEAAKGVIGCIDSDLVNNLGLSDANIGCEYNAPVAGTADNPTGVSGSYEITVSFLYGYTKKSIIAASGKIKPTYADGAEAQLSAKIAEVKGHIEDYAKAFCYNGDVAELETEYLDGCYTVADVEEALNDVINEVNDATGIEAGGYITDNGWDKDGNPVGNWTGAFWKLTGKKGSGTIELFGNGKLPAYTTDSTSLGNGRVAWKKYLGSYASKVVINGGISAGYLAVFISQENTGVKEILIKDGAVLRNEALYFNTLNNDLNITFEGGATVTASSINWWKPQFNKSSRVYVYADSSKLINDKTGKAWGTNPFTATTKSETGQSNINSEGHPIITFVEQGAASSDDKTVLLEKTAITDGGWDAEGNALGDETGVYYEVYIENGETVLEFSGNGNMPTYNEFLNDKVSGDYNPLAAQRAPWRSTAFTNSITKIKAGGSIGYSDLSLWGFTKAKETVFGDDIKLARRTVHYNAGISQDVKVVFEGKVTAPKGAAVTLDYSNDGYASKYKGQFTFFVDSSKVYDENGSHISPSSFISSNINKTNANGKLVGTIIDTCTTGPSIVSEGVVYSGGWNADKTPVQGEASTDTGVRYKVTTSSEGNVLTLYKDETWPNATASTPDYWAVKTGATEEDKHFYTGQIPWLGTKYSKIVVESGVHVGSMALYVGNNAPAEILIKDGASLGAKAIYYNSIGTTRPAVIFEGAAEVVKGSLRSYNMGAANTDAEVAIFADFNKLTINGKTIANVTDFTSYDDQNSDKRGKFVSYSYDSSVAEAVEKVEAWHGDINATGLCSDTAADNALLAGVKSEVEAQIGDADVSVTVNAIVKGYYEITLSKVIGSSSFSRTVKKQVSFEHKWSYEQLTGSAYGFKEVCGNCGQFASAELVATDPGATRDNNQVEFTYDGKAKGFRVIYTNTLHSGNSLNISYETVEGKTLSGAPVQCGQYHAILLYGNGNKVTVPFAVNQSTDLSISTDDYEGVYDGKSHIAKPIIKGGDADNKVTYSYDGGVNWTDETPVVKDVASKTVTARVENPNYKTASCVFTLKVAKKNLTVNADDKNMTAGDKIPELTYTVRGFVGDESFDNITGAVKPVVSCAADGKTTGTFDITASGANAGGNYNITYTAGKLTVKAAPYTPAPVPTPSPDPTPTPDPDQPSTPDTPQAPAKGDVVTAGTGTGQLTFTVTAAADASGKGGTVSFTGCNGSATSVDVPATVEVGGVSYAVTEIAPYAFKGAPKLERVTMAGSIARVGKGAFESCKRLESVAVGTGVKHIGKSVFKGCKRLKTVTVTSRHLAKKKVAGCLKGSSVTKVVVRVGAPKANKSYAKKYAKVFTKKICGKKVAVKASKKTLKK